jgi:hypothetical protein
MKFNFRVNLVVKLWKKYRPNNPTLTVVEEEVQEPQQTPNAFATWKQQKSARRADHVDEYIRYIREPPVPQDHIKQGACSWWLEERQQRLYPNLSRMALDILTIPAMSAAPERLFSSANITISDRRNRLHGDTTEAIECLKSWRKIQNIPAESNEDVELRLDQVIS